MSGEDVVPPDPSASMGDAQAAADAEEEQEPRVLHRDEGRVRILTLNRPRRRNALDGRMREELIAHLKATEADDAIGAIVLTGAGSCFAAGADLRELVERSTEEQRAFLQPPHIYSVIETLRKPVIAALNGHALGAGLELATACDMRVAKTGVKLGQPEVALGLIPGGGGTQRLVRMVGKGNAARLILTGDPIESEDAVEWGLVDVLVTESDCVHRAVELAGHMSRRDPDALAQAKHCLHAATRLGYEEGLEEEVEAFLRRHGSASTQAAIRSFLEKKA